MAAITAFGGYEDLVRKGGRIALKDILRVLNSVDETVRTRSPDSSCDSPLPENMLRIEINVSDDNGEALDMDQTIEFDFVSSENLSDAMGMGATAEYCVLTITANRYSFMMRYDDEDPTSFHEIVYEISEENGYAKFVSDSEEERPFNGLAYTDTYFLLSPWKRIVEQKWLKSKNVRTKVRKTTKTRTTRRRIGKTRKTTQKINTK